MIPPHSQEAEQAILGAMLIDHESAAIAINGVAPTDFYRSEHQAIMASAAKLFESGRNIDLITVAKALQEDGKDKLVSMAYLSELTDTVPLRAQVAAYCGIVKESAQSRRVIDLSRSVMEMCFQGKPIQWIAEDFGKGFFDIVADKTKAARSMADIVPEVIAEITEVQRTGVQKGIGTGFYDLDRRWNGMGRSDLIIMAARPSMGKTCLAVNIGCNVAMKGGKVLMFSLEMADRQLVKRIISSFSRVSSDMIRTGNIPDEWMQRIIDAGNKMMKLPFRIDQTPGLSITELQARAKMESMKNGLDFVIVDYLQLMSAKAGSREQEVSAISRGLKHLAKELDIPVMALSQLNRSLEARTDKRPIMADLRESGAIEQDADIITFIYRDEVYNDTPDNPSRGVPEIITRKQRNGPVGTDKVLFRPEINLFDNLTQEILI
jgi:replicative DNA helicase